MMHPTFSIPYTANFLMDALKRPVSKHTHTHTHTHTHVKLNHLLILSVSCAFLFSQKWNKRLNTILYRCISKIINAEISKKRFRRAIMLYCKTVLQYCGTTLLYCRTTMWYCRTILQYCRAIMLYCRTTMQYYRAPLQVQKLTRFWNKKRYLYK